MSGPLLFSDRGCPFTHRVLALLTHLGVPHERREVPVGSRPEGLERWSPSRRVPFLVHGSVAIGESRVMLEYVAEAYAFAQAYPAELEARTTHRHAMAFLDAQVAPVLLSGARLDDTRLAECLDVLEHAVRTAPEPCLLTFHLAPVLMRFPPWRPGSVVTRALVKRPELMAWLARAERLDALARTSPDLAAMAVELRERFPGAEA